MKKSIILAALVAVSLFAKAQTETTYLSEDINYSVNMDEIVINAHIPKGKVDNRWYVHSCGWQCFRETGSARCYGTSFSNQEEDEWHFGSDRQRCSCHLHQWSLYA